MLARIKKVKYEPEYKNPIYKVILECPEGKPLYIKFDYTYSMKNYMPLKVNYDGKDMGAKLAWYTKEVEKMTVDSFLDQIAKRVNKKLKIEFNEEK